MRLPSGQEGSGGVVGPPPIRPAGLGVFVIIDRAGLRNNPSGSFRMPSVHLRRSRRSRERVGLVGWALVLAWGVGSEVEAQNGGASSAPVETPTCRAVSRIDVRNHSLFAPEDIEDHRFEWALGFANWVHVRTRAGYLRRELLVGEGRCYDPATLEESVRLIRDLNFIARVEATSRQLPDSTWAVHLETWDEWTTQVGLDFDVENEFQFKGFFVTEKNLLGRGLRLSFRYRNFREQNDRNLGLSTGRFLGTRANASVAAGTTRTGSFFRQEILYPFVSEAGRFSLETRFQYEDREHSYLTGDHGSVSHVLLPLTDVEGRIRVGRRYGVPGALTQLGAEVEWLHRDVAGAARQVFQGDFEGAASASDSLAARLSSQDQPWSHVRAGATVGVRRLRFTTATGLDRVSGEQNVALGSEARLTVGRALATWGTSPAYSYARAEGFVSGLRGPLLANASVRAEAWRVDSVEDGTSPWRELTLRGRALLYVQPGPGTTNTFVTGLNVNVRDNVDQPYQVALGGEEGVRSYREDEVPTQSTVVAFVEHRVNLPWFRPALDLGLAVFGDVGRGWAGTTPFGIDTGWRQAVGAGLRLGFPAGTGSVTRIELAWPVGGPDAGRGPVFRTYWSPAPTSR